MTLNHVLVPCQDENYYISLLYDLIGLNFLGQLKNLGGDIDGWRLAFFLYFKCLL